MKNLLSLCLLLITTTVWAGPAGPPAAVELNLDPVDEISCDLEVTLSYEVDPDGIEIDSLRLDIEVKPTDATIVSINCVLPGCLTSGPTLLSTPDRWVASIVAPAPGIPPFDMGSIRVEGHKENGIVKNDLFWLNAETSKTVREPISVGDCL